MARLSIPAAPAKESIVYTDLTGVDLSSDPRNISANRASECVNMYKTYSDGVSSFIETRPGLETVAELPEAVHAIYSLDGKKIAHAGTNLYLLNAENTVIRENMNDNESVGFIHDNKLYILDGVNYVVFNGETVSDVVGYIPTTVTAKAPSGGGTKYQAVNLLSDLRRNSFRGDGSTKVYMLDAQDITSVEEVKINDAAISSDTYTVDTSSGTVTFNSAPAQASSGYDNVIITFRRNVAGYADRIKNCTLAKLFDNRVFISGNSNYPEYIFHSELNDPTYFADISYYRDGDSDNPVMGIEVQNNALVVIKKGGAGAHTIFKHTPATDYELGQVYPTEESVITVGCEAKNSLISFRDDLVFMGNDGLNGITYTSSASSDRYIKHRSTLVDRAFMGHDLKTAKLCEWKEYLLILINGEIYLADSRSRYSSAGSYEYEWFYWNGFDGASCMLQVEDILYFGFDDGKICSLTGLTDNGADIYSCWVSRAEIGGAISCYKTVKEKGAICVLKTIPNSNVEVYVETDISSWHCINTIRMGGFNFSDFNFASLSFGTESDNYCLLALNEKKWKKLRLKFASNKRFGLGTAAYLITVGNYIKE